MYGGPLFSERKDGKVTEIFSHHLGGHIVAKDEMLQQIKKKQDGVFSPFFLSHPALRRLATAAYCVSVLCPVYVFCMKREPGLRF